MNIRVLLVNSRDGDWEQLWVDGKLMYENHMLSAGQVLKSLQKAIPDIFELEFEEVDPEDLE